MVDSGEHVHPAVLLSDDDGDARIMYSEALALAGYEVTTAADGAEALQKAAARDFDVIILDMAMPKLDGMSVLKALRASPKTVTVPIAVVSAFADLLPELGADGAVPRCPRHRGAADHDADDHQHEFRAPLHRPERYHDDVRLPCDYDTRRRSSSLVTPLHLLPWHPSRGWQARSS